MPRVFISYSHDSQGHRARVAALAARLRREGVEAQLDQYEPFPAEGWPKWMANQIHSAEYVLVVCTETYKRRVEGHETPGRGLGAAWEGSLITQKVYDDGGRNTKFIPVYFERDDATHIPAFLAASTRYDAASEEGYEALYRFVTAQPAILKPALGPIRSLESPDGAEPGGEAADDQPILTEATPGDVVWLLPRGFLLLTDLQDDGTAGWAVVASYYDYSGNWAQSTHYHESYRWRDKVGAMETQYRKLCIPPGDWPFARAPLLFMIDVRDGQVTITPAGVVNSRSGYAKLHQEHAYVCPPGQVRLPVRPPEFRPLTASGNLRDLVAEAQAIVVDGSRRREFSAEERVAVVRRVRREIRIEVSRRLDAQHPAAKNVEEIIERYDPGTVDCLGWLRELAEAATEAAECIENQTKGTSSVA
jgi:hypothetical protein